MNYKKKQILNFIDEIIQLYLEENENCHLMINSSNMIVRITGKEFLDCNNLHINELIQLREKYIN